MTRALLTFLGVGLTGFVGLAGTVNAEDSPKFTPEQIEFFESKVRPILVTHCQECHGQGDQSANLRLDSRTAMMHGGDSGPAIAPSNPDASLIVKAIRYDTNHLQMPPTGKMPPEAIATVTEWVKQGAPWSDEAPGATPVKLGGMATPEGIARARSEHWSLRPVGQPAIPPVKENGWATTPIDYFILSRLEQEGLRPNPQADKRTLIRRATMDLHGVPATYEEIQAFEADSSPDAYAKLIDRLLDSPKYGQRWGRYWLDVARYADTKGYVFQEERKYPFSYTYRDYVIRAFNEDLPYNRFIVEQLAADRLDLGDDKRPLAAMGFLTLGRRFLNNQADIIDDRIDVVMRGLQGMTVACARCHDHKFDPIPTADYYSLYGIFASSSEPKELPSLGDAAQTPEFLAFEKDRIKRQAAIDEYISEKQEHYQTQIRQHVGDYLLAVRDIGDADRREWRGKLDEKKLLMKGFERFKRKLVAGDPKDDRVFGPWRSVASAPKELAGEAFVAEAAKRIDELKNLPPQAVKESTWKFGVARYDEALQRSADFTVFAHFKDGQWRTGPEMPDPKNGWASITTNGGHPGPNKDIAAVRRWTAGQPGIISVSGKLDHPADQGDGVRARIVSSRVGLLGEWTAKQKSVNIALDRVRVQMDETLDFIVDCRESDGFDSFNWAPELKPVRAEQPGPRINPLVIKAIHKPTPTSVDELAGRYNKLFVEVDEKWQALVKTAKEKGKPAPSGFPDADWEELRQQLYGDTSPATIAAADIEQVLAKDEKNELGKRRSKLQQLMASSPGAPAHAMVMVENDQPNNPRIFRRGNPGNLGDEVPRAYLQAVAGPERPKFEKGGRLEMANAIVDPSNPLTARVLVNRVWMWHFGQGIVRTPSDFGTRSEPPTHPELLDHLARRFMDEGWSIKKLHRWIMNSRTYTQTSEIRPEVFVADVDNRFYARQNRRRLDFEAMRDSLLSAAGRLDAHIGGQPVDLVKEPFTTRRTVYGFIDRQNLEGLFRSFDFASPDATNPQRFTTTVPQQALFLMNSPFVAEQARAAYKTAVETAAKSGSSPNPNEVVKTLFRNVLGREASPGETALLVRYVGGASGNTETADDHDDAPTWQYAIGRFDEATQRVADFTPFQVFKDGSWHMHDVFPDPSMGYASLTANGGHPGNKPEYAVVRRWTANRAGFIAASGRLDHPSDQGDGVRGRIVSSRHGKVGEWSAKKNVVDTNVDRIEVQAGDTIDFILDPNQTDTNDSFNWTVTVRQIEEAPGVKAEELAGVMREWGSVDWFNRKAPEKVAPLTQWERLAQTLLISNEFMFVD